MQVGLFTCQASTLDILGNLLIEQGPQKLIAEAMLEGQEGTVIINRPY
jgi:hypothetical protein